MKRATHRRPRLAAFLPAALAGLVGLALTGLATVHAHKTVQAEQEGHFQASMVAAQEAIDKRMEAYVALLLAGRGLFIASAEVDRGEFHQWAEALQLAERYPGIRGIGYAAVVPPGETSAFEQAARASGVAGFSLRPPGDRPFRTAILFLEPEDERNRAALGFDMFTDPVRREAMERGRDTGLPAASGPVTLVQEITPEKQTGFLIYVPVYERSMPTATVAQRRAALQGWVYAPFRAQDLIEGIFARHRPEVDVEAYDGTEPTPGGLLFDTDANRDGLAPGRDEHVRFRTLDIAGRPWTLVFSPVQEDQGSARTLPGLVGLVGFLGSVLLFAITWAQTRGRGRERAARAVAERAEAEAKFLADASELLASSLDISSTLNALARRMVPFLGEVCVIDVIGEHEGLERLAVAAVDGEPRLADAQRLGRAIYPSGSPPVRRVVATGKPEIVPVVTDEWLARAYPDPEGRAAIGSFGHRSLAILPLSTRDRTHGAILLASGVPHFFRRSRLNLAEEVARRAAQAIESAWLYRQTQEAVRLRDDFLSIASHELRTPLTSLQAQVQGLRRAVRRGPEALDAEKLEPKLEVIERQVRRLGKLITDLLDVARIRTGRFEVVRERFEFRELVDEALGRFAEGQAMPAINVESTGPAIGRWDRFRLEQVVVNLIGNAVKYGEGKPIDVRIDPRPEGVRFTVTDRGIGIPPEKQGLVFERFARAVSNRHYGGLGLGLFIVREIVVAHGGTVGVESRLGEGATFRVDLPWDGADVVARQA